MHRALFIFLVSTCSQVLASTPLPRSTPESQGVSSQAIFAFMKAANNHEAMHSFMLMRHGHVVAETWWAPFKPEAKHKLYSLSKSFTSTAVGMAIAEGKLSLDDTVISFFPQDAPKDPSWNLSNMRVRDLLCMSTGHVSEDLKAFSFQAEERLIKTFLALPVKHKPGTHFLYNTPGHLHVLYHRPESHGRVRARLSRPTPLRTAWNRGSHLGKLPSRHFVRRLWPQR